MKANGLIAILLAFVCIGCSDKKQEVPQDLTTIVVDWDNITDSLDYSSWVEDSALVIPLETTDDCLIGQVNNLIYQNHKIYLADNLSKAIYVFDEKGRMLSKLKAMGNGPKGYLDITAFTVHDSILIVYDKMKLKIFFYNEEAEFLYAKDASKVWGMEMFCLGESLYLFNTGSNSQMGRYHLFKMSIKEGEDDVKAIMPFEDNGHAGWGIPKDYCFSPTDALFTLWPYDVLYTFKDDQVTPTYRVDFGDKRLPEQYMKADGVTALTTAIKNKYVTGINEIMQTDRYLLLTCNDGTTVVTIYDKQNQGIMSTRNFYNKKLGAMKMEPHMTYIQNGYLIQYSEMESWTIWKELGVPKNWDDPKYTFYSENMRETFKRLQESDAESNPVIIIQKLKGGV